MDTHSTYFQMEYRKFLKGRFRWHAFTGTGKVYPDLNSFSKNQFWSMVGTGIRFEIIPGSKINARLDLTYNGFGGFPYYLEVDEAF